MPIEKGKEAQWQGRKVMVIAITRAAVDGVQMECADLEFLDETGGRARAPVADIIDFYAEADSEPDGLSIDEARSSPSVTFVEDGETTHVVCEMRGVVWVNLYLGDDQWDASPLKHLKREELDTLAEKFGLDPALYPNKDTIIDAIEVAYRPAVGGEE